ncbi:MAG: mtnC [Chloroflexi bacterium]|nr:mtnC [Chloroflexota bacterium]
MPGFLRQHAGSPEVHAIVERLAEEIRMDPSNVDAVAATLQRWIDEDRKHTDLKELQGMIWEEGFRKGAFRGHLYPDVVPFWNRARSRGLRLAIYSSGSVLAQQLLLKFSVEGDVSSLIERNYDTRVGSKSDVGSYRRIVEDVSVPPSEALFYSDTVSELDAALSAGMRTCRLLRPGVQPTEHRHHEITDFTSELA